MKNVGKASVIVGVVLGLVASPAVLLADEALEKRVQRLEQLLEGQGLVDMYMQLQNIQQETRELRGQIEQQSHAIDGLKQRQRDLYLDIDRRLRRLESGAVAPAAPASSPSAPATPDRPSPASVSKRPAPVDTPAADAAYRDAFNLLKEGRYDVAIKRFTAFLAKYPGSAYADNAQYWLGEANYVTRNFQQAVVEFNKVVSNYPQSQKLADALLKIGYCHYELNEMDKARIALNRVVKEHANTTAARLADNRLRRMQLEGQGAPAAAPQQ
ncbi:MAG: tol-pal system protein YbgF [Granulosicoccaceae bacterium]|jgi:tol-pal system protein YbgF